LVGVLRNEGCLSTSYSYFAKWCCPTSTSPNYYHSQEGIITSRSFVPPEKDSRERLSRRTYPEYCMVSCNLAIFINY